MPFYSFVRYVSFLKVTYLNFLFDIQHQFKSRIPIVARLLKYSIPTLQTQNIINDSVALFNRCGLNHKVEYVPSHRKYDILTERNLLECPRFV